MRTKALLVAAALGATGIATVMADPVYSVNVVGFINLSVPANNSYALLANQLNGPTLNGAPDNHLATILPNYVQDGQLLLWDAPHQAYLAFTFDTGAWYDGQYQPANPVVAPGTAFFLFNPQATNVTVTLVGEVPQGTALTTTLGANYSMTASIPPLSGTLDSLLFPGVQDMQVLKWDAAGQKYVAFTYDTGAWYDGQYMPANPSIAVGEAFFVLNGSTPVNWTQNFSVQ